jgi:hypothetical protein
MSIKVLLAGWIVLLPLGARGDERAQEAADKSAKVAAEPEKGAVPRPDEVAGFRAAVKRLEAGRRPREFLGPMKVLREGFPKSRRVLHDAVVAGSVKIKCFAIQVLGDLGTARKDLEVVETGLAHSDERVRLAAIMATQRLGKDGLDAILAHLSRETSANNRKMTIKTLQRWGAEEAVPDLAGVLKKEEDKGVRNFAVRALQVLTGQRIGDDPQAWAEYVETIRLQEQAMELLDGGGDKEEEKP